MLLCDVHDRDAIAVDGDAELRLVLGDRRKLVGKVRCNRRPDHLRGKDASKAR